MSELVAQLSTEWHWRDDDEDGRTVEGRVIPFNEVATIIERDEATGQLVKYQEQFLPGCCSRLEQESKRGTHLRWVKYLLGHDESKLEREIGHMRSIEQRDDGAYAIFRLFDCDDLRKVRSMLQESYRGLSVAFASKNPQTIDGVVSHRSIMLAHVAATPAPAYVSAGITAMRGDGPVDLGTPLLDEAREWLEAIKSVHANT